MKASVTVPLLILLLSLRMCAHAGEKTHPFRLPAIADRMPPVIWGSECQVPEGPGLAFGGEELKSDDGQHHTHFRSDAGGEWLPLLEKLRADNPLRKLHDRVWALRNSTKNALAKARFIYFEGTSPDPKVVDADVVTPLRETGDDLGKILDEYKQAPAEFTPYHKLQLARAHEHITAAASTLQTILTQLANGVTVDSIKALHGTQIDLEKAVALLDAEPGPRALSPLVYDTKSKLFILFGGDHLDYLTNDTWVFDPALKSWQQRHPKAAPAPRANHQLLAADGVVKLTGGYTYSNNTDYMGGPYININDGAWVYDPAADTWTSEAVGQTIAEGCRTYRQGAFHPDFFMQGGKPDPAEFSARLLNVPVNIWVLTKPPYLPQMQRDWGTAIIDPDHDVLLRWSGGHCAHGGSDVVMYHFSTNRWELPFPVELPLGQCYTNTSYPSGFNFNLRPWVTGHTYKSYGYDAVSKRMVSSGQQADFYLYDPAIGDWEGRAPKPNGMTYGGCYYDLLCKQMPQGIACWTKEGRLFFYDGKTGGQWAERKVSGEKLPGSNVDSAGIDYDSKRERLLLFPGNYGKPYSGQIVSVDLKTMAAALLNPAGMAGAAAMPGFLRETCYITSQDLLLTGVTLPPDAEHIRWTPVYDCAANKWIACNIGGPNPAGKDGRNVSMGLVYDAKRDLIWAVDTRGAIFVLRLDLKTLNKKDVVDR